VRRSSGPRCWRSAASGSAWRTSQGLEQGKVETLNLILKGDVSGSWSLEDALLQIDVGEEVELQVIDRGSARSR